MRILAAGHDTHAAQPIVQRLKRDDFAVDEARSLHATIDQLHARDYDVLLIDDGLPGLHLASFCGDERVPPATSVLAIARGGGARQRTRHLDAGADDCVSAPYDVNELAARIRALVRRRGAATLRRLAVADLSLDPVTRQARRGSQRLRLTASEYALLEYLMRHQGRPVSRAAIAQHVWGAQQPPETNVIDVFVSRLRRKIDDGRRTPLLNAVRGVGYFVGPSLD